ncbi:hypothetical protein [Methylorubrum aminovorans]|uniref:hypothetical protein n=1 Tax=Methylorubrum aminovorans TaxID=269069 RepID=UPI003C2E5E38
MNLPPPGETNLLRIVSALRDVAEGATNALSRTDVALSTSSETLIEARLCVPGALVVPIPLDAGAAAAGIFLKDTARGFFVLGHAPGGEGRRVRFEVRRP